MPGPAQANLHRVWIRVLALSLLIQMSNSQAFVLPDLKKRHFLFRGIFPTSCWLHKLDFVEWFLTSKSNRHMCGGNARSPLATGVDLRPWVPPLAGRELSPLAAASWGEPVSLG